VAAEEDGLVRVYRADGAVLRSIQAAGTARLVCLPEVEGARAIVVGTAQGGLAAY